MSEVVRKNLGGVTAYKAAVSKGYTGTEDEFAQLMANYATVGETATEAAQQAGASADYANADALKAEGNAVGQQNGEDVDSDSPYYHNNAKYYADEAKDSETNAGLSEQAAGGSATSAETDALKSEGYAVGTQDGTAVASGSPYYQNNSKYYSEQSAASATASSAMTGLAPAFSLSKAYAVGDYVIYSGTLYKFTAAHAAGAWVGTDATAVTLAPDVADLKSATAQKATDRILDKTNLLIGKPTVMGKYYYAGTAVIRANYQYAIVPVESGVTYKRNGIRFISSATAILVDDNVSGEGTFTPDYTGDAYLSFLLNGRYDNHPIYFCVASEYSDDIGDYVEPEFNKNILAQTFGTSERTPASQKLVNTLKGTVDELVAADYVEKSGTGQVTSTNIEGMTATSGTGWSDNIISKATLYAEGKYPSVYQGHLHLANNANLNTYVIPVDGSIYSFTYIRLGVITLDDEYTVVGSEVEYATQVDTTGGKYFFFCFNPNTYPLQDYEIKKQLPLYNIPSNWLIPGGVVTNVTEKIYGKGFARVTGNLSSGQSLTIAKTNVKKNNVYSFMGKVTSFSSLLIGHGKAVYDSAYIEITTTQIIKHDYYSSAGSVTLIDKSSETGGLGIADYIYVQIIVDEGTAVVKVFSNGNSYTSDSTQWFGDSNADAFVESVSSTLTDCVFAWSSGDFRKSVWVFGDSYLGFTNQSRWPYYLKEAGFIDNVLLSAYPGENTGNALPSLSNMITYFGKPKFIVWCLGMNDGSDTDEDTPITAWMTGVNAVLSYCAEYDITPIFATVPTVPSIYHEGKNKWVRESGYRYIDFADAVGASSSGVWYTGMLSTDNVHPDPDGAIALYHRAILDCPELTFGNP